MSHHNLKRCRVHLSFSWQPFAFDFIVSDSQQRLDSTAQSPNRGSFATMTLLPPEILHDILAYAMNIEGAHCVAALLTTCSLFHDIGQRIIYSALHFTSLVQLRSFIDAHKSSRSRSGGLRYHSPRSVEFDIQNNESNLVFADIHTLFSQCFQQEKKDLEEEEEPVERDENGRLVVDLLRLRMNSHVFDPNLRMIYEFMSLVNPRRFIWTGPDPPHHFSIAIVPGAINYLFWALSEFTNLVELKLTHFSLSALNPTKLPIIPSLRTLYFGQVIFIQPEVVSELVLHPAMAANLERVSLVDAYRGSIWGLRLRRSDVELDYELESTKLAAIRRVVVCEARTERIMGGDRVEENAVLL